MKTKELIKRLQEADPTGETECSIGNYAIEDVYNESAYYDGCLQIVEVDSNGYEISMSRKHDGRKIVIEYYDLARILLDNPDFPIEYSEKTEKYRERDDERRDYARRALKLAEISIFKDWLKKSGAEVKDESVESIFDSLGLSRNNPLPSGDGCYYDKRLAEWSDRFEVTPHDYDTIIRPKKKS